MGTLQKVRIGLLKLRRRGITKFLRRLNLLKISALSRYPKTLRNEWWELAVRHQMYLAEARFAYACRHGYSLDKANEALQHMLEGIPVFPSSIKFEADLTAKEDIYE